MTIQDYPRVSSAIGYQFIAEKDDICDIRA